MESNQESSLLAPLSATRNFLSSRFSRSTLISREHPSQRYRQFLPVRPRSGYRPRRTINKELQRGRSEHIPCSKSLLLPSNVMKTSPLSGQDHKHKIMYSSSFFASRRMVCILFNFSRPKFHLQFPSQLTHETSFLHRPRHT